jgi:putative nucleotidyltransferase with HDIG domain
LLQVLQLLEFSDCSVADLAKVIVNDPSMAAKVLKVANSSFYGHKQGISTINQAITVLGFATLKNVLLSMSVIDLFSSVNRGIDLPGLWNHSIATAVGAKLISQRLHYPNGEKAYTTGLLHDIGKIIIAKYIPGGLQRAVAASRGQNLKLESAEVHVLGASHADVGAWLLHQWRLPSTLVEAVRLHHQPTLSQDNYDLTAIVYLANILAHHARIGSSGDRDDLIIDNRVFSYYKFKDSDWIEMRETLHLKKAEIHAFSQSSAKAA